MLKKLTLLAMAVGALVAFAAPAIAQADTWRTDPGEVAVGNKENDDDVLLTGTLTTTTGGPSGIATTCEAEAETTVWNEPEATGEVTGFRFLVPTCVTNIPGCEVEEIGPVGLPWHIDAATGATATKITEAAFFNQFNGGNCETLAGIPQHVPIVAEGDATGTWDNNGGCIRFSEDGDMVLASNPMVPVLLDGSVCNANLTLK